MLIAVWRLKYTFPNGLFPRKRLSDLLARLGDNFRDFWHPNRFKSLDGLGCARAHRVPEVLSESTILNFEMQPMHTEEVNGRARDILDRVQPSVRPIMEVKVIVPFFIVCWVFPARVEQPEQHIHILNTPKWKSGIGAFSDADRLSPSTSRVLRGSITPSSQIRAEA